MTLLSFAAFVISIVVERFEPAFAGHPVLLPCHGKQDVDGRDKPGDHEERVSIMRRLISAIVTPCDRLGERACDRERGLALRIVVAVDEAYGARHARAG